jgi:ubiquinone/menaquinone biosynthesis C-methylase UbiE
VGCGIGTDTINFARAGADVTAVELSNESLRIAAQRADVMGVGDRIRFVQANAEELTAALERAGFDVRRHLMVDVLPYPHVLYICEARP